MTDQYLYCKHANESPLHCTCSDTCPCKQGHCKERCKGCGGVLECPPGLDYYCPNKECDYDYKRFWESFHLAEKKRKDRERQVGDLIKERDNLLKLLEEAREEAIDLRGVIRVSIEHQKAPILSEEELILPWEDGYNPET